ncbi:MAG: DMT family transporter [Zoogloeaceae bacterium]|nr:DMT family transporter [Zoogloeaceae bacterium]
MRQTNQARAMLFAIAAVLLWSTAATAFKLSLRVMSPTELLAWSALVSTVVLAVIVGVRGEWAVALAALKARPLFYATTGALNPCGFYLTVLSAYELLPAQQAQTLNITWALTLSLLAVPLLKQKLVRRDLIALLVGYFGAVVIATRGNLLALEFDSGLGVALALGSTVLWALYWIANTRASAPAAASLLLCFMLGTPMVWLILALQGELALPPLSGLAGAVYVGLFEMGVTFMLWLTAMRHAENVSRISNLIFLSPFLSLFFINMFLDEAIEPATWVGLVLIIAAVTYQQRGRKAA